MLSSFALSSYAISILMKLIALEILAYSTSYALVSLIPLAGDMKAIYQLVLIESCT